MRLASDDTLRALRTPLILLAGWLVFSQLIAPGLIRLLYSSDALSWIEAVREARQEGSLDYLVSSFRRNSAWLTAALLIYAPFAIGTRHAATVRAKVGRASAASLGGVRIVVCGVLCAMTLFEDLPSTALLSRDMVYTPGLMQLFYLLPGFEGLLGSRLALGLLQVGTAILLLLGVVGWKTRWVLPLAALGYLLVGGITRQYTQFYHQGLTSFYLLLVLCFSPCGDGWSVDSLLNGRRSGRRRSLFVPRARIYAWARFACWTVLALCYVVAGLSKLRRSGFSWWDPDNMRFMILRDSLLPMSFEWTWGLKVAEAPDPLLAFLGFAAVAIEVLYGLVLVSRRARLVLPLLAVVLHVGILLMQRILFVDLLVLQLLFLDPAQLRRIGRRLRPRRAAGSVLAKAVATVEATSIAQGSQGWPRQGWPRRSWPRRVRRIAGLLLFLWAFRVETYPLTAWQMYSSHHESRVIEYHRVLSTHRSGDVRRAPLGEGIGAVDVAMMAGTRYRRLIARSFESEGREVAEDFLIACARAYNRRGSTIDPIESYEVQRWRWHFLDRPADPNHGSLVESWQLRTPEEPPN